MSKEKEPQDNPNMELWNKVCVTKKSDTKDFSGKGGFKGTCIKAQSQRKRATETFGPYGIKWGVESEKYLVIALNHDDVHDTLLRYTAQLYYDLDGVKGAFPICAEIDFYMFAKGSWRRNTDVYKKVRTDALTKGLSELGFNSDIFEGHAAWDDNKYGDEREGAERPERKTNQTPIEEPDFTAACNEDTIGYIKEMGWNKGDCRRLWDEKEHNVKAFNDAVKEMYTAFQDTPPGAESGDFFGGK